MILFSILRFFSRLLNPQAKIRKDRLKKISQIIDAKIRNEDLFIEALTHRSVLDDKNFKRSNERLEFLGDSVLGFVIAEELFTRFPDKDEGFLTKVRSNFVNKNSLFEAASRIKLEELIFIQKELFHSGTFGKKTVIADAYEALIGAIYLDCGFQKAATFITNTLSNPNIDNNLHLIDENYKSQLLEYAQSVKLEIPRYYVVAEEGPEHDRLFTVEVKIGQNILGTGKGRNKKTAEQEAAKMAMSNIEHTTPKQLRNGA